jgi:hypothetical protein
LVVDCEGCFGIFVDEEASFLRRVDLLMLEHDRGDRVDYAIVNEKLASYGLTCTRSGFHSVYQRLNK